MFPLHCPIQCYWLLAALCFEFLFSIVTTGLLLTRTFNAQNLQLSRSRLSDLLTGVDLNRNFQKIQPTFQVLLYFQRIQSRIQGTLTLL